MRTLREWCQRGALPATKHMGGDWRVDMHKLKASAGEAGRVLYEDLVAAINDRSR